MRRGRGFAGSPITDSVDDSLAKAAHLHHYEQTKQKIIGSDNGINNDEQSDDEADLEEANFSIYVSLIFYQFIFGELAWHFA